jgi:hypothetical protein
MPSIRKLSRRGKTLKKRYNHSLPNSVFNNIEPLEYTNISFESPQCEPTPPPIIVIPPSMKVYQEIYNKITHSVRNPVIYPNSINSLSSSQHFSNRLPSIIDPNSIVTHNISTNHANLSQNKQASISHRSSRRVKKISHQKGKFSTRKNKKN